MAGWTTATNTIERLYDEGGLGGLRQELYDRQDETDRPDKTSLYATLQTVYSMDHGEDDTATAMLLGEEKELRWWILP